MGDPLSIAASVIAVAGLTYASCRTLNNVINGFINAPGMLTGLRQDLNTIEDLLRSLIKGLDGVQNSALSANQRVCLMNLKPAIESCEATCNAFATKLSKLTSHSAPNRVNWLDKARLHFNENDISMVKTALQRYMQTLDVALGIATLQTVQQNHGALQSLETKIADSMSEFTGQVEGLQLAVLAMSSSTSNIIQREDVKAVVQTLKDHDLMLRYCLKVCESGLQAATMATGTKVKHAAAFDKASVFVGNMGLDGQGNVRAPAAIVDLLEARGEAKSAAGNMSAEVAKSFWSK